MNVQQLFHSWRMLNRPLFGWGLAWFLANEFCQRYYASHGIAPFIIEKEGLGYYGISLESIPCRMNKDIIHYGRMAMGGDVENWRSGGLGDHGLPALDFCKGDMPTEEIVRRAIEHMGIEPIPKVSHYNCRHKRWGGSYTLCFEIATILAIRLESAGVRIWNHPYHTQRVLAEIDPTVEQKEHLGAFLIRRNDKQLVLAADGRLLDGSNQNVWLMYMDGHSTFSLAEMIEEKLMR